MAILVILIVLHLRLLLENNIAIILCINKHLFKHLISKLDCIGSEKFKKGGQAFLVSNTKRKYGAQIQKKINIAWKLCGNLDFKIGIRAQSFPNEIELDRMTDFFSHKHYPEISLKYRFLCVMQ